VGCFEQFHNSFFFIFQENITWS